jgi:hypothetical protein
VAVPVAAGGTAAGASLAVTAAGCGGARGSGGGKKKNQARITRKLSAVARMRFLF